MNNLKASSLQSLLESDRGSNDSLLAESLQFDIEELDDAEYSIPTLETLPTLESVLSELDIDSDLISENSFVAPSTTSTTPSIMLDHSSTKMGTILRHVVLQGITSQIGSAADRVDAGLATSFAISDLMMAIGTSHGHILAFDNVQTLRWCSKDHMQQGAVSTLSFNSDCSRLLAGFARGHIIMIDTNSGDTLRSLVDVITPNTGVLHLKWTSRPALALCSDSGGSVWSLTFTRRLGIRGCESRCLFSGARGEVCALEPLNLNGENHPLKSYTIAALATLSKFFVVMIRPRLKVIKYSILSGPSECLPLLAWQMVLIQAADSSRVIDPVLAIARGYHLYFHQICYYAGKISLIFLRHITLTYNILALHWMGPKSLACLDQSEILHLIDVRTNKELECIDMACAGLVYGSAQFKGFATGGNVSPALALAGTHACYNTILSKGSQIYFLGARSLHSVNVRAWNDRITHLVTNFRWTEACLLAIEGYRSAGTRVQRKHMAKQRILQLLDEYLIATEQSPQLYLGSIINCLIEIKQYDLLWQEIWERQRNNTDTFICLITEHIENGNLTFISPIVSQVLVEYWLRVNPNKLDEIVLKLDWKCLDLHQILTAAKREKLFNAQIYLNAHALGDYSISLTELIPKISSENRALGNSILVYISSCLAGRRFPTGDIDDVLVPVVKHEILRCLTSIHSSHATNSELSYPYLRALLKFDIRETLNVLSLAFQEKEFDGDLGQSHRQLIINILLEIVTPESSTWSEIGCLLNFIAQQIAMKNLPNNNANNLLEKVLDYLKMEQIDDESVRQHFEREEAWLELLNGNCLTHINHEEMLVMAKNAKCYRVMEYLYEKYNLYDNILNCYLLDSNRHIEIWHYIELHAMSTKRKIFKQIYENFEKLLIINPNELTQIIINNFRVHIDDFIKLLDVKNDKYLFIFLDNLQKNNIVLNADNCEIYLNLLCQFNPEQIQDYLEQHDNYRLDSTLDILRKYQLNTSCIYLLEKQGDYMSAFNLSLDMLKDAPESTAELNAIQLNSLCLRASQVLCEEERLKLWFPFLTIILQRPDLTQITKNILYSASLHVDLTKLVQLVLKSGTSGNFGDIKHLLVGMLSNSKYETLLLQTTSRILGNDLHKIFRKNRNMVNRGICIKSIICILCNLRLYSNNQMDIIIFGHCGHAIHKNCLLPSSTPPSSPTSDPFNNGLDDVGSSCSKNSISKNYTNNYSDNIIKNSNNNNSNNNNNNNLICPDCDHIVVNENESLKLAVPNKKIVDCNYPRNSSNLQVEAPPRIGIGS